MGVVEHETPLVSLDSHCSGRRKPAWFISVWRQTNLTLSVQHTSQPATAKPPSRPLHQIYPRHDLAPGPVAAAREASEVGTHGYETSELGEGVEGCAACQPQVFHRLSPEGPAEYEGWPAKSVQQVCSQTAEEARAEAGEELEVRRGGRQQGIQNLSVPAVDECLHDGEANLGGKV